jgi:hypothetical protein
MIGVKFSGRLGNQIFQYVFYQYLKTNNRDKHFFFVNPHHAYLTKYFDLGTYDNRTLSSKVYSIFTRSLGWVLGSKEVYIQNIQVPRDVQVKDWTVYKGFFKQTGISSIFRAS